jgi:hypothetical protein
MIAFSFSRGTFFGLIAALALALLFTFFGGWLVGVLYAPAGAKLAAEADKEKVMAPVEEVGRTETQPAPAPKPVESAAAPAGKTGPAPAAAPAPTQAPAPAPAPAPASAAASPAAAPAASTKQSPPPPSGGSATGPIPPATVLPPSPLSLAMSRPLERFGMGMPPAEPSAAAPEKQNGAPLSLLPEQRSIPRELNAQLGRLENAEPVYSVEVGTFTGDESADRLYARLEGRLYDVYRVKAEPPLVPQTVISVRVGAFDQRPLADAAALELRNREGLDARVVRVDPGRLNDLLKAAKKQTP